MSDTKKSKPIALTENDNKFIAEFLEKHTDEKKVTDVQRVLLNLIKKEIRSITDIKNLKSLIKKEKQDIKALLIVANDKKKEKELEQNQDKALGGGMRKAIDDKKMFDDNYSYKQVLQKMIDDGVISDDKLFSDFLKTAPDGVIQSETDKGESETDKSDNTAKVKQDTPF